MNTFRRQNHTHIKATGGYMLIEILVSLSIFALIAVASSAALLSIVDANIKSQSIKSVMDNVSVALENMSRTVRIGTDYKCFDPDPAAQPSDPGPINGTESNDPNVCNGGKAGMTFVSQDGTSVRYYFMNDPVTGVGTIYRYTDANDDVPLTSNEVNTTTNKPEVNIKNTTFFVFAAGATPGQARVLVTVSGEVGQAGTNQYTPFTIQTTISQRQLESQ